MPVSISLSPRKPSSAFGIMPAARLLRASSEASAASARCSPWTIKNGKSRCWFRAPMASARNSKWPWPWACTPPLAATWSITASTTSWYRAPSRSFSSTTWPWANSSRSCRKAGCALIGGETAEMPGFYPPGEYDLAGFIVGAVDRKKLLTGKNVQPGDALLALPSSGLHTNRYSLARKLIFEGEKLKPETYVAEVGNKIGAELLKPHLCYAPALRNILAKGWVSALAHITGGGIPGNLPRVLPNGLKAEIDLATWPIPAIFKYLAKLGKIDTDELLQSFNMGVGMILVVPPKFVKSVEADLKKRREKFFRIGRIERSDSGKARVHYSAALNL